ncbi:MAG: hypothetical protein H6Q73_153 [Firmicutes bacterium]|nr:hypothetical protein [Bacillota bacterium]
MLKTRSGVTILGSADDPRLAAEFKKMLGAAKKEKLDRQQDSYKQRLLSRQESY